MMIEGGKLEFSDKNLSYCHIIYKLHMNWPVIKLGVHNEKWMPELWHGSVKWLVSQNNENAQTC